MMNPMSARTSKGSLASSLASKRKESSQLKIQSQDDIYCILCSKRYEIEQYKLHNHKRVMKRNVHYNTQPQELSHKFIEKLKPAQSFILQYVGQQHRLQGKYEDDRLIDQGNYNNEMHCSKIRPKQSFLFNSLHIEQPNMKKTLNIKEKFQPNPENMEDSFNLSMQSKCKIQGQTRQLPRFRTLPSPSQARQLKLFNFKSYNLDQNESEIDQVRVQHRSRPKNILAQSD